MELTDRFVLNEVQKEAAQCFYGPVLIFAGAGSGKTRVLTHRIANMLSAGISPKEILAITFTNKAANEMKERLYKMCPNAYGLTVCTIHSFCARVLREYADFLDYTKTFTIYDEQDCINVIKRITSKRSPDDKLQKRLVSFISNVKTFNLTKSEASELCGGDDLFMSALRQFDQTLKTSNAMSFDDLLINTLNLIKQNKEVLSELQNRYRFISIDEFQDTNKVQYDIFKLICQKNRNIFAVGDDDQSIYRWRGAEIQNILGFQKDFPDAKVFTLQQNYRSTAKILSVANEIISKNTSRHKKDLFTQKEGGVKVELLNAYDEIEEARFVVEQIAALTRFSGYAYSDFAVLMRINSLSRSFEQECLKYNIPFKVFGGFKFFERKEIKDILAYMRMVENPYDNEAVLRVINVPARGIGKATCDRLSEASAEYGMSIIDVLSSEKLLESFTRGADRKLREFYDLYLDLAHLKEQNNLYNFAEILIKRTGYKLMLQSGGDEEADKIFNLDELLASVEQYVKENGENAQLSEYLQSVSLYTEGENADKDDYVSISTIHSAKGLEFKTVFVVGLDSGIFPLTRAMSDLNEMEEERRLAYVAVTRAKERLYLTRARSRFLFGERKQCLPSTFFSEAASSLLPAPTEKYDKEGYLTPETKRVIERNTPAQKEVKKGYFKTGDIVNHTAFGEGIVLSVEGENAVVAFAKAGKKTLSLKYAPLTKKE